MKLFRFIKKKMCKHDNPEKVDVKSWFYSHGPNTCDPRFIVVQAYCWDCHSHFVYDIKNRAEMEEFKSKYPDKRVY